MSKQTAVEFLFEKFNEYVKLFDIDENHQILLLQAIKTAKEMEKEQMILIYKAAFQDGFNGELFEFEKYYNETFKSE